jgi:hypothetical protein
VGGGRYCALAELSLAGQSLVVWLRDNAELIRTELKLATPELRTCLDEITRGVRGVGRRALVMGGCVRDSMLGLESKDLDVEV